MEEARNIRFLSTPTKYTPLPLSKSFTPVWFVVVHLVFSVFFFVLHYYIYSTFGCTLFSFKHGYFHLNKILHGEIRSIRFSSLNCKILKYLTQTHNQACANSSQRSFDHNDHTLCIAHRITIYCIILVFVCYQWPT